MIKAECVELVDEKRILVSEKGMSACFVNEEGETYTRIKVDGCVFTDGEALRADWVIERNSRAIVVELKGKGVERACKQVNATAKLWKDSGRAADICALIVCSQFPKASTSVQLAQLKFKARYGNPLHVAVQNREYIFANVFTFHGLNKKK